MTAIVNETAASFLPELKIYYHEILLLQREFVPTKFLCYSSNHSSHGKSHWRPFSRTTDTVCNKLGTSNPVLPPETDVL